MISYSEKIEDVFFFCHSCNYELVPTGIGSEVVTPYFRRKNKTNQHQLSCLYSILEKINKYRNIELYKKLMREQQ